MLGEKWKRTVSPANGITAAAPVFLSAASVNIEMRARVSVE